MTNRFLISAAVAALIAGTGFANAQGTGTSREGASGAAPTQQSAPSTEHAAPSVAPKKESGASTGMKGAESQGMKGSENSGMKASESNEKAQPGTSTSKSAQDNNAMPGQKSKSMSSENENAKGGKDMKAEGRDSKSGTTNAAESRDSKTGNMNAQTKGTTDSRSQTTTGNAATSATAAPPAEKRTQIVSAIKSEKIEETTNVNFNIAVGTVVPSTVRFHPLPARIVEIYPEWRGYDVIFVHGQYIIVRPQTHEIVYIIEG
ncbi:hypothetical protein V1289_009071 [Bradyrhizobium sp. AZCC 2289]